MNVQCSGGIRSFAKETRGLKMRSIVASHQKLTTTNWEDHQGWPSYSYTRSCRRTQCRPFYSHWAFEVNWKGEGAQQVGVSWAVHAKAQLLQPCPTLGDPVDFSLPGSSVHGALQGKHAGVDCHALLKWGGEWTSNQKNHCFWRVVLSYSTQQWTISLLDCDVWWKVDCT